MQISVPDIQSENKWTDHSITTLSILQTTEDTKIKWHPGFVVSLGLI